MWDLDWSSILPWTFDDVVVEHASYEDVLPFIKAQYPKIFGDQQPRFLPQPLTDAKRRFGAEMDVFLFRTAQTEIGVLMAHPSDWTTYYMRSVAFLPEHRNRGVCSRFLERVREPLRAAGVERIEGDCSPTNGAMVRMLSRQGYVLTSTSNSERWGFTARFTQFLSVDAERTFRRQHCAMPHPPSYPEERSPS